MSLHPVMAQALAPWAPRQVKPRMFSFEFDLPGFEACVTCELEYSPAERGSRDSYGQAIEPDEPASMELRHCYIGKFDVVDFLSYETTTDIEEAALAERG